MAENEQPPNNGIANAQVNPLIKGLLVGIAVCVMPFVEVAKGLKKAMREKYDSDLLGFLGLVLALVAGALTAKYFYATSQLVITIGATLGAMAATHFYGWPLLFLFVVEPAFKLSNELWKAVDCEHIGGWFSHRRSSSWLSNWLMNISWLSLFLGALCIFWLGMMLIAATMNYSVGGYIMGVIVGFIFAIIAGGLAAILLFSVGIPVTASALGIGLVTLFAPYTQNLVGARGQEALWGAYVLELAAWEAYLFPLLYAILANGFRWVFDLIAELHERVYATADQFSILFSHLVNIALAVTIGFISVKLWTSLTSNLYLANTLATVVAALSYIYVYEFLVAGKVNRNDNESIINIGQLGGLGVATYLGYLVFQHYAANSVMAIFSAIAVTAIMYLLNYSLIFPIAYLFLKTILNPTFGWSTDYLVKLYQTISENFRDAYNRTYLDASDYRNLFLHIANIAIAATALVIAKLLITPLTAMWVGWTTGALLSLLSYMLVGRLLLRVAGIKTVSSLVSALVGAASGAAAYSGNQSLLLVAFGGLLVAILTYHVLFPISYIIVKLILASTLKADNWLRPLMESVYRNIWNTFSGMWREFVLAYYNARQVFTPIWQSVIASYVAAKQQVKDIWYKAIDR